MIITKNLNGSLVVSDIIDNQYVKYVFYGYNRADAKKMFLQYVSELSAEVK